MTLHCIPLCILSVIIQTLKCSGSYIQSNIKNVCPMQKFMPFAVIGSDREVAVGGKKILGRQTKWGFVEVENKRHCEFSQLRDMLIR